MIEIPLTQGKVALIDDCDAHLAAFKWYAHRGRGTFYAVRSEYRRGAPQKEIRLHREVLGITDPDVEVDHRDGNGLDCRRHNLRQATPRQNQANRGQQRNNTSGYKGVSWNTCGWQARIRVGAERRYLGVFATPEDAARAYDEAARRLHGDFVCVNFPRPGEQCCRTRGE